MHVLCFSPWLGLGLDSVLRPSCYKWASPQAQSHCTRLIQTTSLQWDIQCSCQLLHGIAMSPGGKTLTQCKRDLRKPSPYSSPRPGRSDRTWELFKHLPTEAHHRIRPGHGSTPPKEPCSMGGQKEPTLPGMLKGLGSWSAGDRVGLQRALGQCLS